MQILTNLSDYENVGTQENLILTVFAVFAGLWVFQLAAFVIYSCFSGEIFGPYKYRVILARHTMDLTSMVIFCYMGFEGLEQLGGTFVSIKTLITASGSIAAFGSERSFIFSSAAQRLCVWQIAYEAKNFCDSVIHNDGVIFLVHHTATGLLAVCYLSFIYQVLNHLELTNHKNACYLVQALCLRPFLHIYCAYFLGCSEVSTAFLCALACFDAKRGIAPLAKSFPMLMKVIGGSFAVLFVIFRVVLWPYFCYFFWIDSLELLRTGSAHSVPILYLFMFINTALTILQIVWLHEIYVTALKVFAGDGNLSIVRGTEKKKA